MTARGDDPIALLVRHGETEDNRRKVFRSWTALPLNEAGKEQARKLAEEISGYNVRAVFSSPLERAFQTARIFSEKSGLPVIQDRRLMGWKTGTFEGLAEEEVDDALKLFVEHSGVAPPLGVSLDDFEAGVADFLEEWLPEAEREGPFVFFSHNSVVTAAMNLLEGKRAKRSSGSDSVAPGGILAIHADGSRYRAEPIESGEREPEIAG